MRLTMLTLAQIPDLSQAVWIPTLPFVAMVISGLLAFASSAKAQRVAAWLTVAATFAAFLITLTLPGDLAQVGTNGGVTVHFFEWINLSDFHANFSFFIDPLTIVMLMVVTGIGTLIALYAAGYMSGDAGYGRFFAYISLFIFAMTTLVMADNLALLYLGWEGVGAASYLLIGFYYRKPSAVAAAKKAFIVNRIGDLGFALGLFGVFVVFGSVAFSEILPEAVKLGEAVAGSGSLTEAVAKADYLTTASVGLVVAIPFLLMLGAFGKSAQLPLHVWLPDAMEGPTPVSALIHAATMVTAGVYMIARLLPVFALSPGALDTVAVVGGVTALFAATIALCQFDLKRIWAYSTVSQLGFMFMGVGVLGATGAVFHLFTHAFFKALLFLTAGSVMHAMAGQLDLRRMSGLRHKMPVTAALMLVGCLALAGVPGTSGFFSKDMILTDVLAAKPVLGVLGIVTALITAFYTFRLWFRVFTGPVQFEMGHEHHGYVVEQGHGHGHGQDHGHGHDGAGHGPHEMPWWPMNAPLLLLALGAVLAGYMGGWMGNMVGASTAGLVGPGGPGGPGGHGDAEHHAELHTVVSIVTGVGSVLMIGAAWYLFNRRRDVSAKLAQGLGPVVKVLFRKYYVDEIYHAVVRLPLHAVAWVCYIVDSVVLDNVIVDTVLGRSPRVAGWLARLTQRGGALQGYAVVMGLGLVVVLLVVAWKAMANT
jgi:NADH-quinone oxidoreductase subunit L